MDPLILVLFPPSVSLMLTKHFDDKADSQHLRWLSFIVSDDAHGSRSADHASLVSGYVTRIGKDVI